MMQQKSEDGKKQITKQNGIYFGQREFINDVFDHLHLQPHQRVNHFRNHYELTRKDLLIKNLKRQKKTLEKDGKMDEAISFNFWPTTQNLPADQSLFVEEFKRNEGTKSVQIMKPIGKSQGKGIFLFNKLAQIQQWKSDYRQKADNPTAENYVVQRQIMDPLLMGGKKFDVRIQVLVTGQSPLTVWFQRTGFARFTHSRYNTNLEDINNSQIHLTNVAVQKTADNYDEKLGGKWDLRSLKLYMMSQQGMDRVARAFEEIQDIVVKSLLAVQKCMINDKHCFELQGYDIILDSGLKPWLLEVNASPSMTANTQADHDLKCALVDDTLTVIDLEHLLTGYEEQIGGFDLIYKGGPVKLPGNSAQGTHLGCLNNREVQIKKLAKSTASRLCQEDDDDKNGSKAKNTKKTISR